MSRFLGRILCKKDRFIFEDVDEKGHIVRKESWILNKAWAKVRYVDKGKQKDGGMITQSFYVFDASWLSRPVKIGRELVDVVVGDYAESHLPYIYEWSMGYAVKTKKTGYGSQWQSILFDEYNWFWGRGRTDLFMKEIIASDEEYCDFCKIHYLFKLSASILTEARRKWKRVRVWGKGKAEDGTWVELSRRKDAAGKIRGSYEAVQARKSADPMIDSWGFSRRIDEETYKHNQKVAVMRGFLWMFMDNEKLWCECCGEEWNEERRQKALQLWASMR